MSGTNFPGTLDTTLELGGNWLNLHGITDPVHQIDATFRTNIRDAMFAVEARIGETDSIVPSSLTWATISQAGVDNLGLRFQQGRTQWPGDVGENGLFLYSTSLEPMFHRAGEPITTFYSLITGGGGGTTWDAIYAADKDYVINAAPWTITQDTGASGLTIDLTRDVGFAGAASIMRIANLNTSDGEAALELQNDGIGPALLATSGTIVLNDTLPASAGAADVTRHLRQVVTGGVLTHPDAVSAANVVEITSGGMDGSGEQVTVANITFVTGIGSDGSGGNGANLIGHLIAFGGKGIGADSNAIAVHIGSGWDEALLLDSGTVQAEHTLIDADADNFFATHVLVDTTGAPITPTYADVVNAAHWTRITSGAMEPGAGTEATLVGHGIQVVGHPDDDEYSRLRGIFILPLDKDGGDADGTALQIDTVWDIAVDTRGGFHRSAYTSPVFSGATVETYAHHQATTTSGDLQPTLPGFAFLSGYTANMEGHVSDNVYVIESAFRAAHDGVGGSTKIGVLAADIANPFADSVLDIALYASARDGMYVFARRSDDGTVPASYDTTGGKFDHVNTSADLKGTVKNVWSKLDIPAASTGSFYGFAAETTSSLLNATESIAFWVRPTGNKWKHAFVAGCGALDVTHIIPDNVTGITQQHMQMTTAGGGITVTPGGISIGLRQDVTSNGLVAAPSVLAAHQIDMTGAGGDLVGTAIVGNRINDFVRNGSLSTVVANYVGADWDYAFSSASGQLSILHDFPASAVGGLVQRHIYGVTGSGALTAGTQQQMGAFVAEVSGALTDSANADLYAFWAETLDKKGGSAVGAAFQVDGGWDLSINTQSGKAHFSTGSATFGDSVLELQQLDDDEPFFTVFGKTSADQANNLTTSAVNGDAGVTGPQSKGTLTYGWEYEGMMRVNVGGTDYWMPFYSAS